MVAELTPMYFDRQGKPMTLMEWVRRFDDWQYKRVALDRVDGVEVSTVWLGLNHNLTDGPVLIFETMVFGGDNDELQRRYSTEAEALAGHNEIVAALKTGKSPE